MSNWRQWEKWTNVPFPGILKGIPFPDVLKDMMAEACIASGLRWALLASLEARFGGVSTDLLNSINKISDADRLHELIHISVKCSDLNAFLTEIDPIPEIV